MRSLIAWHNVIHQRARAAAALCGVVFAILLIYMQLGFYDSCFRSSTMVYDQLRFDIALVSPQYVQLRIAGQVPRHRLIQARNLPGVGSVSPLYIANGTWLVPESRERREITVLGIDPGNSPFRIPEVAASARRLVEPDTAIMDRTTGKGYGRVRRGTVTELEHTRIEIVGTYAHGTGFVCDASIILSDRTLVRVFQGYPLDRVTMGLVTLAPGADADETARGLRRLLPPDVRVLTRNELEEHEQRFFVEVKPVGIMFSAGVLVAFLVGAVTLYQVLSSEIRSRLKECAMLMALGHEARYMQGVVVLQAILLGLLGFAPATLLALGLYELTRISTNLPLVMTWLRVAAVLALAVVMCAASGLLVSWKVSRADPAELL